MRFWWISLLTLLLVNCTGGATTVISPAPTSTANPSPTPEVALQNYGPAPELTNDVWLNVDAPLRLANLRGQVVLMDMWTYG